MAKSAKFICKECKKPHYKWQPTCFECGGEIIENVQETITTKSKHAKYDKFNTKPKSSHKAQLLKDIQYTDGDYYLLNNEELDYFFGQGKGIENSAFYLIYGDPGAGKSTFLSQLAELFTKKKSKIIYNSGEEAKTQIKNRTVRLFKNDNPHYYVSSHKNIFDLIEDIEEIQPKLLIIDSMQTMYNPENDGVKGGVSQIRDVTDILMNLTKDRNMITFVISHVNGEGDLAGPATMEHMVDGVFYLENPSYSSYRILRSQKNRFGKADELVLLEMKEKGMKIVKNPSAVFIEERGNNTIGSVIIPTLEGSSSMLIELQGLVVDSSFNGHPVRNVNGVDRNRLIMLLAIIEKHIPDISFQASDVYVNIVNGFKSKDYSIDLGLAKAVISSYYNTPVKNSSAYLGELGLSGELRSVPMIETRVKECYKLGIKNVYLPYHNQKDLDELLENNQLKGMKLHFIKNIKDII